jgi:hypothetical protein
MEVNAGPVAGPNERPGDDGKASTYLQVNSDSVPARWFGEFLKSDTHYAPDLD